MKYFLLSKFKLLSLFNLEGVPIKILPDSVGNLCLLHYLGLRRTKLIELPSFIGRPITLETLDIRDTSIRDLPQDLEQLNKLRHLLLASSFDHKVVNLPVDIASFKDLQTLAGVKLTKRIGENLKELQQLQKLSVGKVNSNLLNQLAISINRMESLRSLTIKCDLGEQILARSFTSLIEIQMLRIEGEVLDMLGWIKNLKSDTFRIEGLCS
ncbi:hypothetical protein L6164_025903 [Bauhinia variegata]|uniref:Uncharacterized protein n=1 Tax=Bauhinia variegata TaxID=167791 RepID=A0ACB9M5N2_BAUVA|nr:hypothetical protein L6164_025903 [Bauhinia variegata]